MRIGIFETDHFEVAHTVIRLFDNGENELTIFVYKKSFEQLQFLLGKHASKYTWVVKEEHVSKFQFIRQLYRETRMKRLELLYLNTVSNNFILYAGMIRLLKDLRIILTLHDINNYFHGRPGFTLRQWIRYIGKKWLVSLVQEFNVINPTMVDYLRAKLSNRQQVHCVSGAFFDEKFYKAPVVSLAERIHIVVPGSVDVRRRNYEFVFSLLEDCQRLAIPVQIVLLGGVDKDHGKQVLSKAKAWATQHDNLLFYETEIVDQPEFDRVMREAHLVYSPSVIDTIITDDVRETYGISISSGNMADLVRYARPALLPKALNIPLFMEKSVVRYEDMGEIIVLLQKLRKDPVLYERLLEKALTTSRAFTIDAIREHNPALFGQGGATA